MNCTVTVHHSCTNTVPSEHPQAVQTNSTNSTLIAVKWSEVPPIDQNGIIISYEVKYEPLETFGGLLGTKYVNTTDGAILETVLDSLQEYVEYNVSVRAYTDVGAGPFSPEVTQSTLENGKFACSEATICELPHTV